MPKQMDSLKQEAPVEIRLIESNKKRFLDLLLLADEQEDMIDRYLERGDVFALYDGDLKASRWSPGKTRPPAS